MKRSTINMLLERIYGCPPNKPSKCKLYASCDKCKIKWLERLEPVEEDGKPNEKR